METVRYFVSYAHEDAKAKDELLGRLQTLFDTAGNYQFEGWQDRDIPLGDDWRASIEAAIEASAFGLLMVSPAFLASPFIRDHELPRFRRAIPVGLGLYPRNGEINERGLEKLQIFFHKGKFYSEFRCRQDKAKFVNELFVRTITTLKGWIPPVNLSPLPAQAASGGPRFAFAPAAGGAPPPPPPPGPPEIKELIAGCRDGLPELTRNTNGHRLPTAITRALDRLAQVVGDPAALRVTCALVETLERSQREIARAGLDRCFGGFGLGRLALRVGELMPRLNGAPAAAAGGRHEVANDWDTDSTLPQAGDVAALLEEIDQRLAHLARPLPGLEEATRQAMLAELVRLESLLYADPLPLAELDAARAALEQLERDLFALLIRTCQMVLGAYAGRLPDLAVFRDRLADGSAGPELVVLPVGRFLMGSPESEEGRFANEGPQHAVVIGYRLALGRTPVTFAEYDRFCAGSGAERPDDQGWGRGRRPVINVSWHDAQGYVRWLSECSGQAYRLPSEAEWEYACRAGSTGRWYFGDDERQLGEYAWFIGNSSSRTQPVGQKRSNGFGLYDMLGNVWDWVEDRRSSSYKDAPVDGRASVDGDNLYRVARGGSSGYFFRLLRAASRYYFAPEFRYDVLGFRVARTLNLGS